MYKFNLKRERIKVNETQKVFHSFPTLPETIDLREKFPPVYDQGTLGSCTAQAGIAAYSYLSKRPPNPSRLFLYYNERMLDGDISYDAGSSLYQCVNALKEFGVCPEIMWPYELDKFTIKPPQQCYDKGKLSVVTEAKQLNQTIHEMKRCLASGSPFILGIMIYPSFISEEVTKTGNVPMPSEDEKIIGGHAIVCLGYDESKKVFIMRNSWSTNWGDNGHFYLPYDYLSDENLATDCWVIRKTSR